MECTGDFVKLVLIYPKVGFKGGLSWEPLGLGYLGSYIKKHYPNADISFYNGYFDKDEDIINGCKGADYAGFSITSPQLLHAITLTAAIRKVIGKDRPEIIYGGVHPSAEPLPMLKYADWVVRGEGEESMLGILMGSEVGPVVHNAPIEHLDRIPFPDRRLIRQDRHIEQVLRMDGIATAAVLSSRGCPFKCSFCGSHTVWGREVRYRSAQNILDEIMELVYEYDVKRIVFADDNFCLSRQRVIEFCRLVKAAKLGLTFGANIHANTWDEEMLDALEGAGFDELMIGVESGSKVMRREYHKNITDKKLREFFSITKGRFRRRAYMILGGNNETHETIAESERLVDELEPDVVGFTLLAPYPGTEYQNGGITDTEWAVCDEYGNPFRRSHCLSNEELMGEQRRLKEKYGALLCARQRQSIP